ncbi:hypothetical protein LSUE1_G005632 [Lachnellula suecica]|uniref:Uncharacterized protein n=1 Tax=Lachnellula suecica TaxID=602035 RepID=A0A8T9C752_9HELO|nr:hypothetical protein LSUE1_G005632 [Lachnellula suecica]
MPLIQKLHPSGDMSERVHDASLHVIRDSDSARCEKDSGYEDFGEFEEDECLDSDMEGSVIHRPRPKKTARAPVLPQRSDKRTSRLLAEVMVELQNLDGAQQKDMKKKSAVQESDPHELYLSSEEDASLSDDYEDSLFDLDLDALDAAEVEEGQESTSRPSSRREVTARVVSMTFVKPNIVNITTNSTTTSPVKATQRSMDLERPSSVSSGSSSPSQHVRHRSSPLSSSIRRMSISSIAVLTRMSIDSTNTPSTQPFTSLPPRKSSRLANLTSLVTGTMKTNTTHEFLNTDPYPSEHTHSNTHSDAERPVTPRTPTSMAASAFKKGLTRGLARARKPSMQRISAVYAAGNNSSRASLSLNRVSTAVERPTKSEPIAELERETSKSSEPQKLSYEDSMKNVTRKPTPQPLSASSPKSRTSSMFLGRRKSIKY